MNMVGNVGAGGPVGGMVMMSNGSPATSSAANTQESQKISFNTYIYEYFLKSGFHDLARSLSKDQNFEMRLKDRDQIKQSPGRRKDGAMNGMEADSMDMDVKDDIPDDLPRPNLPTSEGHGSGFLFDWFCIFSDLFSAQRKQPGPHDGSASAARQYLMQTQNMQRLRERQQNHSLPGPGMPNQFAAMRGMRNGVMVNGDMQKANMTKNMTQQQMQQLQAQRMLQQQQQQQMQREQSEMDMNGRQSTPVDGENGGSPSKRPRLGEQQFNGAMGPNGRAPGMPGVPQQMLMQSGFNPANMNQAQFRQNGAMQQKAMQGQMGNAMMNMNNPGSPMLPMSDPQFPNGMPVEMYSQRMPGQGMQGGPGAQGGNHALQDYQMQLMLLEQQNKKRLMMARQEQDNMQRPDGSQLPGGIQPPGLSPSGSRTGTSPNPMDQMKRNAQLSGMPGSPAPGDGMQGRSPAAMNFMNNGMPPEFNATMFMKPNEGMAGPGGPGMRPPTSMSMEAMRQQGRMPAQFPGGQPMVQQPSQGQPQMGTPGQRSDMPPPSAPAAGNPNAQRPQPTSPQQQSQAPPTPSQSNKANPKKKGKEGDTRKKPNKKNSTANAPPEAEPPATSTPSTPITSQHPTSFNNSAGKGVAPGAAPAIAGPTSNPSSMPQPQAQPDLQNTTFPDYPLSVSDQQFNLDFSTLDSGDVLENFDFDSFLNTNPGEDAFSFPDGVGMDSFGLENAE